MIFILTGEVGSGKTTYLRGLVEELRKARVPFDGFLSLRVMKGGEPEGYDLLDIRSGESWPFLRRVEREEERRIGPYSVLPGGLAKGLEIIRRSAADDLLIVDELGPLELEGGGFWPVLKDIVSDPQRTFLVVVRGRLVGDFEKVFMGVATTVVVEKDRPRLLPLLRGEGRIAVKVKFFAYFRQSFGVKERDLSLPCGATIRQALDALADTPARRAEVFAGGELKPHIVVMINGAALPAATGLETPLMSGDVVAVFPMMGGG